MFETPGSSQGFVFAMFEKYNFSLYLYLEYASVSATAEVVFVLTRVEIHFFFFFDIIKAESVKLLPLSVGDGPKKVFRFPSRPGRMLRFAQVCTRDANEAVVRLAMPDVKNICTPFFCVSFHVISVPIVIFILTCQFSLCDWRFESETDARMNSLRILWLKYNHANYV